MRRLIPRWLELQMDIDFAFWKLDQIRELVANRTGIAAAIDRATGYEDALTVEATELMERIRAMRAEFDEIMFAADLVSGLVGQDGKDQQQR